MEHDYFDYAATTPLDPDVLDSMLPFLKENFGNTSSTHWFGQKAERAIDQARQNIAATFGCEPDEIIFTSGGSESDNLALRGTAFARKKETGANVILTTRVEHEAVLKTARDLEQNHGFSVTYIPVDSEGRVILEELKMLLSRHVALVSVIYGNNEVGTINPVSQIGNLCHDHQVPFHTDAVQAMGYVNFSADPNIDLVSAGAHKFYGPKGVGFLYRSRKTNIQPVQTGGSQERNLRAGTHNVAYIVGMAVALQKTRANMPEYIKNYQNHRESIIENILHDYPQAQLTGSRTNRLANHASFVFPGLDGNQLVMLLDMHGIACSSGSACKTGNPEPSEVLLSLGYPGSLARGSLRLTVGRGTTSEQVKNLLIKLDRVFQQAGKQK